MFIAELFSIFIDVVTPVFALVAIGYFAGPRLNLNARTLSRTAYFILIPCFIFSVIGQADVQLSLAIQMTIYIAIVHIICALLGYGVARLMGRSGEMAAAFVLIAVFGNVGNFGLSMIEFRLGPEGLVPGTVYFLAISTLAFVISVMAAGWTKGGSTTAVLSVFKTPALLALIPVAFFRGFDIEVPLSIARITGLLGQAMIPVMLLTLGVQLSEVEKLKINLDTVVASSIRLIGGPAIAFALLLIPAFATLGDLERGAGILQASMPAAVLSSIIAIEYDISPEFVTTTVLFSTIASLITLTIVLALV